MAKGQFACGLPLGFQSFSLGLYQEELHQADLRHAAEVEAITRAFYERGMIPAPPESDAIELDAADRAIRGDRATNPERLP